MNYNELTKKMKQAGWEIARQNGSHVIYKKEGKTVSVPNHGKKDIATGTLQKLLKDTGLK